MELFGNDFGDDLFEELTKKSPAVVKSTPNWIAHMCEPEVDFFYVLSFDFLDFLSAKYYFQSGSCKMK